MTGGNRNDVTQLMSLLEAVPPVRGRVGRPLRRPGRLPADRGYDHDKYRRLVWGKSIKPIIARRGSPHGSGLGVHRYVVERTIGLLHWFRRLRIRWEIRDDGGWCSPTFTTMRNLVVCSAAVLRRRVVVSRPQDRPVRAESAHREAHGGRGRAGRR
ncbi:hypothetical protein GCM10009527_094420 [Actinomadura nitritigenes]